MHLKLEMPADYSKLRIRDSTYFTSKIKSHIIPMKWEKLFRERNLTELGNLAARIIEKPLV